MIVVSGGLVLVAIILLIVGLVTSGLEAVYASIAVSIVAGIFLLLGALQKRGEPSVPAAAPGLVPPAEPTTAVTVTQDEADYDTAGGYGETVAEGPQVAVVPGRPRYHVSTCRFLAGRDDVEYVALGQAQEAGYSACGVCKPDAVLAATDEAVSAAATAETGTDLYAAPEEPAEEPAAPAKPARKRTAARAAAAPAEAAAPAKRTAAATKSAPSRTTATVVVIPDRDKFHTAGCRFVRDVAGTMTVSKATAKRQGYAPCGVCKP